MITHFNTTLDKESIESMLGESRSKTMDLMSELESMKAVQRSMADATAGLNDELNARNYKMQELTNNFDAALKRMRQAETEVGDLRKALSSEREGRLSTEAKLKQVNDQSVFNNGNISTEALHKAHNSKIAELERSYEQMIQAMQEESRMMKGQLESNELELSFAASEREELESELRRKWFCRKLIN